MSNHLDTLSEHYIEIFQQPLGRTRLIQIDNLLSDLTFVSEIEELYVNESLSLGEFDAITNCIENGGNHWGLI